MDPNRRDSGRLATPRACFGVCTAWPVHALQPPPATAVAPSRPSPPPLQDDSGEETDAVLDDRSRIADAVAALQAGRAAETGKAPRTLRLLFKRKLFR